MFCLVLFRNQIYVISRLGKMKLLPGKLLKGIPVGPEHFYTMVHPVNLSLIFYYLSLLTGNLKTSLYPAHKIVSRTESNDKKSNGCHNRSKNEKAPVLTFEQLSDFSQL